MTSKVFSRKRLASSQFAMMVRPDHVRKTLYVTPPKTKIRQGAMNQRKIRAVCEGCNNGWMSGIVDRAKPFVESLILGESDSLGRGRSRRVGFVDFARHNCRGTAAQKRQQSLPSDRTEIHATGRAPSSFTICIGRNSCQEGKSFPMHYSSRGSILAEASTARPTSYNAQLTTGEQLDPSCLPALNL